MSARKQHFLGFWEPLSLYLDILRTCLRFVGEIRGARVSLGANLVETFRSLKTTFVLVIRLAILPRRAVRRAASTSRPHKEEEEDKLARGRRKGDKECAAPTKLGTADACPCFRLAAQSRYHAGFIDGDWLSSPSPLLSSDMCSDFPLTLQSPQHPSRASRLQADAPQHGHVAGDGTTEPAGAPRSEVPL